MSRHGELPRPPSIRRLRARTWQVEAAVVAAALGGVAIASGKGAIEWLAVAAVFFTWSHASVADRLAEAAEVASIGRDRFGPAGVVACHRWAARYYWAKELLWFAYFAWLGAWSALAGCVLFLVWPLWRQALRRRRAIRNPM